MLVHIHKLKKVKVYNAPMYMRGAPPSFIESQIEAIKNGLDYSEEIDNNDPVGSLIETQETDVQYTMGAKVYVHSLGRVSDIKFLIFGKEKDLICVVDEGEVVETEKAAVTMKWAIDRLEIMLKMAREQEKANEQYYSFLMDLRKDEERQSDKGFWKRLFMG
ncbi:hypothetical protein [Paenibacillus sp. XY044]|uniref:hypothetical protein n=1 Tax=Paenibacillus sp. XY044 TaxID=2026089 RepID=UPI000B97E668|nr:hypothetical protein [Paenibacillus sp. XY044]OZB90073.1 hypothetical protein CJP46_35430 [Paenibacillus sp. XY044]